MKLAKSPIASIVHSLPLCDELALHRCPLITFHKNCSYYKNLFLRNFYLAEFIDFYEI